MLSSFAERDRRWGLLHKAMAEEGFDVLIFAANDYRGHKGSLRYIADYNLAHRYGYAVMFSDTEPIMVLPQNLGGGRRPRTEWVADYRYPHHLSSGLVDVIAGGTRISRIGVVGLNQVMKVEDYRNLVQEFPKARVDDAGPLFERVRAIKSEEEIRGAEESAYITDRCFQRLLEFARPGMTERTIAAEMYRVATSLGGEDPLFLTMYADTDSSGTRPTFGVARDRELAPGDVLTFSYELVGPRGYWVELSRMVTFAPTSGPVARVAGAVGAGLEAARGAMAPGVATSEVQRRVIDAVESRGFTSSYWSGHGLGLDVLEEPWIGLDVVQDSSHADAVATLDAGMVLAVHPMLWEDSTATMGYMSDTYVVDDDGARVLSQYPVEVYRV